MKNVLELMGILVGSIIFGIVFAQYVIFPIIDLLVRG